jgi:hypothetical protein
VKRSQDEHRPEKNNKPWFSSSPSGMQRLQRMCCITVVMMGDLRALVLDAIISCHKTPIFPSKIIKIPGKKLSFDLLLIWRCGFSL